MTWHFPAEAHAAATPDRYAVCVDGKGLTWRALLDAGRLRQPRYASALEGVSTAILRADRHIDWFPHLIALLRAGQHIVLLDPESPAEEIQRIQQRTGATQVIDAAFRAEIDAQVDTETRAASDPADENVPSAAPWNPERILFTVMTSGTTGEPRPIDVSCEQVIFSTLGSAARLGSLPQDRWHAPLPLHHVGGIMVFLRALILGFCADYVSKFDPAHSAKVLQDGSAQLASFVPVMLSRIVQHSPKLTPHPSLRAILLGGAATPDALLQHAKRRDLPIARSWGMSETTSQIATAAPRDFDADLSPLPFAQITINKGILHVDGPQAHGGSLQTSDRGSLRQGRVQIHGRADDLFISGGENIDPLEIEQVLLEHHDVQDALVFGVPSEAWGHTITACIVSDTPLDATVLRTWCQRKLARFKLPKTFYFVHDIPRNALGKPSRKHAQELAMAHTQSPNPTWLKFSSGAES